MNDLKPELYWAQEKKQQRTMLVGTFLFVLIMFLLVYQIPTLIKQKWEIYNLEYSDKLFDNKKYKYREFLDGTLNMDEIIKKKQIIEWNILQSKNPNNYKYIESYISKQKEKIWLEKFKFSKIYNFRNQWKNTVILNLTITDSNKLVDFITEISNNGYLWRNMTIQKEWGIFKGDIELVFDIK